MANASRLIGHQFHLHNSYICLARRTSSRHVSVLSKIPGFAELALGCKPIQVAVTCQVMPSGAYGGCSIFYFSAASPLLRSRSKPLNTPTTMRGVENMNPYCPTGISQGAVQERMDWYNVNVKAAVIAIAREQEALGRSIHIRHSWLFLAPECGFELTGRDGTMIQVSVSLQSAVQVLIDLKGVEQLGWINIGDTVEVGTGEAPMFAKVFSQCLGQFLQTASDPGWFYDAVAPSIRF